MVNREFSPFPAEIPFGYEIQAEWLKNDVPILRRMIVVQDDGFTVEATFVDENESGEEVYSIAGGTTGREQIIGVSEAWSVDRALKAYVRSFDKQKTEATPQRLEEFKQWWLSKGNR